MNKQCLGDSVWVEMDSAGLILTIEDGDSGEPWTSILLAPETFAALVAYVNETEGK